MEQYEHAKTVYKSGAVRDSKEGVGRCDLLPLRVVDRLLEIDGSPINVLRLIENFKEFGHREYLEYAFVNFVEQSDFESMPKAMLEVSILFQQGAEHYGEGNWKKGIPVKSYIDSATRHYLKWLDGWTDERHDRAVLWNLMCASWTCEVMPELNGYLTGEVEENEP